jgi:hypothetical protein
MVIILVRTKLRTLISLKSRNNLFFRLDAAVLVAADYNVGQYVSVQYQLPASVAKYEYARGACVLIGGRNRNAPSSRRGGPLLLRVLALDPQTL